jgi:hypothetical protein
MNNQRSTLAKEAKIARSLWTTLSKTAITTLNSLIEDLSLRVSLGDVLWLDGHWYVTHSGLIRIARRNRCHGILVQPASELCDPRNSRWAFQATVYRSRTCRGFVGFGDADPSNVSPLVHGAEMRVAETRAVNRALRKAYGIGICSVEEIGLLNGLSPNSKDNRVSTKTTTVNGNGNYGGRSVRDRLCLISASTNSIRPL